MQKKIEDDAAAEAARAVETPVPKEEVHDPVPEQRYTTEELIDGDTTDTEPPEGTGGLRGRQFRRWVRREIQKWPGEGTADLHVQKRYAIMLARITAWTKAGFFPTEHTVQMMLDDDVSWEDPRIAFRLPKPLSHLGITSKSDPVKWKQIVDTETANPWANLGGDDSRRRHAPVWLHKNATITRIF